MKLRLVKLSEEYREQLFDMLDEWMATEESIVPMAICKNDYHDFEAYMENLELRESKGAFVPDSTFFCLDEERNIFVGAVNIRHYLTERLLFDGGHIGDGVRPSERRKGIATEMIGLALEECRKLGMHKVLMVCDKENIGSAKSIQNNGGVLENEVVADGITNQRYWIAISPLTLEEFDYSSEAVINPWDIYDCMEGMPKVLVSCFSHTTFERMLSKFLDAEVVAVLHDAASEFPVYRVNYAGTEIGLLNMPVGAASAGGCLEEVYQLGAEKVILFGTCGVLDSA